MNSKQSARNLPTSSPHSAAEPPIDFRHIRHLLREKVRFIVLCTLGAMTLAGVYLFLAHPIYSSTATLVIEQQDRKTVNTLLDSQDTTQNDLHTLDVIKTVEQSLTSDALALRVIQANGLATNPHFVHPRPDKPYSDDELLLTFAKRVLVKLRRGTRLIDVTAESDSPLLAKQIAQSLINEYLHDGSERAADVSKSADDYLTGEAAQIRSRLEKVGARPADLPRTKQRPLAGGQAEHRGRDAQGPQPEAQHRPHRPDAPGGGRRPVPGARRQGTAGPARARRGCELRDGGRCATARGGRAARLVAQPLPPLPLRAPQVHPGTETTHAGPGRPRPCGRQSRRDDPGGVPRRAGKRGEAASGPSRSRSRPLRASTRSPSRTTPSTGKWNPTGRCTNRSSTA